MGQFRSVLLLLGIICNLFERGVFALTDSERISVLEQQVADMQAYLDNLEPLLVQRYVLIWQCEIPKGKHGVVTCAKKLKPGVTCQIVCDPGYIETPGKSEARCRTGGIWSIELQGDSSIEVLSLYPSQGCDNIKLPDMPTPKYSPRKLHNLLYRPPREIIA